jgi:hypothetical protein
LDQIGPVYAVIVAMIYPWSLLRFFWRVPSWLYFSSLNEMAVIYAYTAVVNLVESLFVLLGILALSLVLPKRWFRERFVSKGGMLASLGLGYLMYFNKQLDPELPFPYDLAVWTPATLLGILVLVFLLDRVTVLARLVEGLADRLVVFLYISLPVSGVALMTVLIRNIF